MPSRDNPLKDLPKGFWFEEITRGSRTVLIVMIGSVARGTIEVENYEEKAAWTKALTTVNEVLNSMLEH